MSCDSWLMLGTPWSSSIICRRDSPNRYSADRERFDLAIALAAQCPQFGERLVQKVAQNRTGRMIESVVILPEALEDLMEARAWYDETDPVHGFDHVLRVLGLAVLVCAGLVAYAGLAVALGALDRGELAGLLGRRRAS